MRKFFCHTRIFELSKWKRAGTKGKKEKEKFMINPFSEKYLTDRTDEKLVSEAVSGNRTALEELILRHQAWIYNISLRMVWDPQDAKDLTQEILIKIITKLDMFKGESHFRTWVYRITANHVINMKKRKYEQVFQSFSQYSRSIRETPDLDFPDEEHTPADVQVIIDETRIGCMLGMIMCLDREQRLVFILGEVFGVTDKIGSEILEISRDNFRKKLSRARHSLNRFMNQECGLIHPENRCLCTRKAKAMMDEGTINLHRLRFSDNYVYRIKQVAEVKDRLMGDYLEKKSRQLFRDHPFQNSPDFVRSFRDMFADPEFRDIFNLKA